MKIRTLFFSCMIVIFFAQPLWADAGHKKPYIGSEAFEQMKQLIGEWEGSMDMGKGPMKFKTTYRLTSGGSAIVETAFAGMPHEMTTIYHDNSKRQLTMIHYCAEQNQPRMNLISADTRRIAMELSADSDIDVAHEKHMHAITIEFEGKDQMTQYLTPFENGQKKDLVTIALKRQQAM